MTRGPEDTPERGTLSPELGAEVHGVAEVPPKLPRRPGASLRRSVTAFCHGWQGKPAVVPVKAGARAHQSRGRVVGESRECESSIEDGKR